jgi:hypothetical protein
VLTRVWVVIRIKNSRVEVIGVYTSLIRAKKSMMLNSDCIVVECEVDSLQFKREQEL